jgi:PqqD family protein of HPr-rel-A system
VAQGVIDEEALLPDAKSLERLAISESGFVFDPVSGHSFTVNETGLAILRAIQKQRHLNALRERLLAEYDVDRTTLDRDLLEFLGSLRDQLSAA